MMTAQDRLIYMANQIARNLVAQGPETAALMVADHIAAYWEPRMRDQLLATPEAALDPVAAHAIELLRTRGSLGPQTPATRFSSADQAGGSDAG